MKNKYYLLIHCIEIDEDNEDVKYIGVYETEEEGEKAIELLIDKPGFRDYPNDFYLTEHTVGITLWESGFFTE